VNGELVDDAAIRDEMRALRPRYEAMVHGLSREQMEAQLRDWSRENIIERVLLRQHALSDPDAAKEDEIRLKVDKVIEKVTAKVSLPRHKELTEYYRKNKEQFRTAEGIPPFEQVKELIENGLHERKKQRAVENFLDHLKAKAVIQELVAQ